MRPDAHSTIGRSVWKAYEDRLIETRLRQRTAAGVVNLVRTTTGGRKLKEILIAAAAALMVSACASRGREISPDMAQSIVQGETTKAEMFDRFGQPIGQGYTDGGVLQMTWMYVYVGYANIGSRTQMLSVLFDEQDRVKKFTFTDSNPADGVRLGH